MRGQQSLAVYSTRLKLGKCRIWINYMEMVKAGVEEKLY